MVTIRQPIQNVLNVVDTQLAVVMPLLGALNVAYRTITVAGNVAYGLKRLRLEASEEKRRVEEALGQVSLTGLGRRGATDNSIALVWINGTTAQQRSPVNSIVVGQRQHVVCQRVGNSVEFYIDGVQVTATAGIGHTGFPAIAASTTTAYLGRRAFSGFEDYFDGSIELARVRNRALTARAIASLAYNPYQIYRTPNFKYIDTAVSGGSFLPAWAFGSNASVIGSGIHA